MPALRNSLACAFALLLVACGGGQSPAAGAADPAPDAAVAGAATAPVAADAGEPTTPPGDLASMIAAADLRKGKVLFLQCRACHSLVPETESGKIGPTLYGVVGRRAGTAPGFQFSDAVAASGITWTPDQIDRWLQRPSEFLPGNKMVFAGVKEAQDRANIIAFIQDESTKPVAH